MLAEATSIRRASALEERILIDGAEWTGALDGVTGLEETDIAGCLHPSWQLRRTEDRIPLGPRRRRGAPPSADSRMRVWSNANRSLSSWCPAQSPSRKASRPHGGCGSVLAVTRQTGTEYDKLALAAQAMLQRHDLLKDLRLVLGAVAGKEAPSVEDIGGALERRRSTLRRSRTSEAIGKGIRAGSPAGSDLWPSCSVWTWRGTSRRR